MMKNTVLSIVLLAAQPSLAPALPVTQEEPDSVPGAVAAGGVASDAHAVDPRDLRALLGASDLVFEGVAVGIHEQLSVPAKPGQRALPFTLVTYRVEKLLAGPDLGSHVTLRFMGGQDPASGLILAPPEIPHIDLGERDILFVQGNTKTLCPLVGENSGRLRVVDGQVFTDLGRSVRMTPQGALLMGQRFALVPVLTKTLGGVERVFPAAPDAVMGPSDAVQAAHLTSVIAALAPSAAKPDASFVNAVPGKPFLGPDFSPVAPPQSQAMPIEMSEEERVDRARIAAEEAQARARIVRQ